jgi:hypothetical protein
MGGCLKEGRPVVGRFLVPGRAVERPEFVKGGAWVTYEVRRKKAEPPFSGAYDWAMVNYDTGERRPLVENAADRWGRFDSQTGLFFIMTDETEVPSGTAGTLVLLDLDQGVLDRIPGVGSYSAIRRSREFLYRTVTDDGAGASLHYRSGQGVDRALGFATGQSDFRGDRLYYVACTEAVAKDCMMSPQGKTLSRFTRPDGPVETLRTKVNRFVINDEETWAVLGTPGDGTKPQIVALPIAGGTEKLVPASQNAYWMGLSGDIFVFAEPAAGTQPATVHTYNLATEAHVVTAGPAGLVDIREVRARPNSTDLLFSDSRGQLAVVHEGAVNGNLIAGSPAQLSVTEDGKYALWIELLVSTPPLGRLMVQDLDFSEPPRVLSPKGSMVPVPGYFFIDDIARKILVFWARYGQNGVDLYYADHRTGDLRMVAESISQVVVTAYQVVGIVGVSPQDLTGDLVNKDLALNQDIVLAHEVADDAIYGDRVVFVIRERVTSERGGLWAIGIDGTPPNASVAGPGM